MAEQRTPAATERLLQDLFIRLLAGSAAGWAQSQLTMPQLKVLLYLAENGSARVSWLASLMGVSPPNITGILDRLEQRGWIARTNDPRDRRVVRIILSETGDAFLQNLCAHGAAAFAETIASMPPEQVDDLGRHLESLLAERAARSAQDPSAH